MSHPGFHSLVHLFFPFLVLSSPCLHFVSLQSTLLRPCLPSLSTPFLSTRLPCSTSLPTTAHSSLLLPQKTSLICAISGREDLYPTAKLPLALGLGLSKSEPTGPETVGLEKAYQGHPGRASALQLFHLSELENLWYWVWVEG